MRLKASGRSVAALGQRDVERRQEFAQRVELFRRRLVVHAIDQRNARALAGFRRGDVGEDHELLDQPMRFEPLRHDHAIDGAVGLEHDLALGNFEVERAALVAGAAHRPIRGIKRFEDRLDDRLGDFVGPAGNGELRLLVMQPRGGADQHAMEGVRAFAAVGADHHAHRERRAVLVRPQRA